MQDATPQPNPELNLIEEELQKELRSMFELDTQTYLQTYEQVTKQLQSESWTEDIQELYRAIHTIKGGAVTVGANSVLATTTALEEMLSDLRYLQTAPELGDGGLIAILMEAGEIVSGSLLIGQDEEESVLNSALKQLKKLHENVQAQFLVEIDEHQQLCQDFANQGFDLMVLELEMALEQIPEGAAIPGALVDTGAQAFTDLETVGKNLEIGNNWSSLIQPLFELLLENDGDIWRSRCKTYLSLLKDCALEGGNLTDAASSQLAADGFTLAPSSPSNEVESDRIDSFLNDAIVEPEVETDTSELDFLLGDSDIPDVYAPATEEFSDSLTPVLEPQEEDLDLDLDLDTEWITEDYSPLISAELPEAPQQEEEHQQITLESDVDTDLGELSQTLPLNEPLNLVPTEETPNFAKEGELLSQALKQIETTPALSEEATFSEPEEFAVPEDFLESLEVQADSVSSNAEMPVWEVELPDQPKEESSVPNTPVSKAPSPPKSRQASTPKIPVPLDRLDRSARALVEILLSARATQGRYQSLQNQVAQIVQLYQESADYITQLRQMQDDYALLQDLQQQSSNENGVQLETYRGGYTAINRLLENSLRLSEIGAEAAATAQITKQEFNKLNLNLKTLQNSVEESRLISFKSVAFRLRAIIRDLINRMGKPVEFMIEGESQNIDAGTIQIMEPALLHLIRNAYDHGIESQAIRQQNGKPEKATITLSLKRQGSLYYLTLIDDGGGIDREKISSIAASKRLPLTQTETQAQLLQVISQPGFSSQKEVSTVSGRGVGMDVVHHQVQSAGGSIKLMTQLGQGTQFEIKLPVPHLLVPCFVVKAGPRLLAIPTDAIQTMRLWDESCIQVDSPDTKMMPWQRTFEGNPESMMPILNYWNERLLPADIDAAKMETAICLRISTQSNDPNASSIWVVIDDLVEELDLLISPLPSPLVAPIGMMGMSTLPTGDVIPVIEAGAIAKTMINPDTESLSVPFFDEGKDDQATHADTENSNLILVVDDAALLRRRLEVSLINYGYEVHCCRDGLEAWNWLQENPSPGLMITDIEMPQMDGLTLVDRCRQSGRTFPIMVSSSRLAEEWSKEAQRVGATDYLTKGFSTQELIERVSGLISKTVSL